MRAERNWKQNSIEIKKEAPHQRSFFFISIIARSTVVITIIRITEKNPKGFEEKGTFTFIPQIPDNIVGTAITIVIEVSRFISILKLFEITEAKTSITTLRTSE